MKRLLFVLLLATTAFFAQGQNVAGYWYGNANVTNGASANNYLVELILKQHSGTVNGILNYYFKNTFRSVQLNGTYNTLTRELKLFNIPVTYFASLANLDVDCEMDFVATLRVAKAGSNLNGKFVGRGNYKYTCPDVLFDLQLNKDA